MSEKYYVYLIKCEDARGKISYYTGYSNNPERRLKQHKGEISGGVKYCLMRKVLGMRIISVWENKGSAMRNEQYIKNSWSKKEKSDTYVYRTFYELEVENFE